MKIISYGWNFVHRSCPMTSLAELPIGRLRDWQKGMHTANILVMLVVHLFHCNVCNYSPHQLGVESPLGAETCVHSVRNFLQNPTSVNKVLVKIDFRNAFNTIRRDVILNLVKLKLPHMYNFVHQCYAIKSNLFFWRRDPQVK